MGFIKKWEKIIIAVVVFVGMSSLPAMFSMPKPSEVPTSNSAHFSTPEPTEVPTPDPAELSTPAPTVSPVFATTPESTELPTDIFTPISVETPQAIPIPSETTPPSIPTATLPPTPSPTSPPLPSPTSPPLPSPIPPPKIVQDSCASGHDFHTSIWETATCLKGGYYNNVCERCGLVESVTEEPLPHDVEDILIQEGNCMQDTVIRHICKSCGQQVESDTRYTPEVHKWISAVVNDMQVFYCEWCGVVQ